jgi:hypothetical protein
LPQPSDIPPRLPSAGQFGTQLQVAMQVPLLQTLPATHLTPAQRFTTHWPPLQISLLAQWTPAQGLGAAHVR